MQIGSTHAAHTGTLPTTLSTTQRPPPPANQNPYTDTDTDGTDTTTQNTLNADPRTRALNILA